MPTTPHEDSKPTAMIMWVIWFSVLSGLFMIRQFAASPSVASDEPSAAGVPVFLLAGILLGAISMAIRWWIIPRLKAAEPRLVAMIVGLALAESAGIIGMVVVPPDQASTRASLFAIAVVCIAVSAPVYTRKSAAEPTFREPS